MVNEDKEARRRWLEESVLSYQERKKLKGQSFCGPNKTYPAHDATHARNCLARASQNKAKLGASYSKIVACCRARLRKFGGKSAEESIPFSDVVKWFMRNKDLKGD